MVATMSDLLHCKIIAVRIVDKRSILNKIKKDKITIYIHALFEGFAFASGMFFEGFAFTSARILLFFINIIFTSCSCFGELNLSVVQHAAKLTYRTACGIDY